MAKKSKARRSVVGRARAEQAAKKKSRGAKKKSAEGKKQKLKENTPAFVGYFDDVDDPRRKTKNLQHRLLDIIVIAVAGVICGADTWAAIEVFGNAKIKWFKTFLRLPNGIPSHDTFGRVFAMIDPAQFRSAFAGYIATTARAAGTRQVAVDGKSVRRSREAGMAALHMVSAWAAANRVVLGQVSTDEKSNEITAIPELLRALDLEGKVVTIDAIGCQKAIAALIIEKKGHYVLAVKANQEKLHTDLEHFYNACLPNVASGGWQTFEEDDSGHGREVRRRYRITTDLADLTTRGEWAGIKAVVVAEVDRLSGSATTTSRRYYITSLKCSARQIGKLIRGHWGIENGLHWVLDVALREDESRVRKGHAQENLVMLRHLALNVLRGDKTHKVGVHIKRLAASWDHDYLLHLIDALAR